MAKVDWWTRSGLALIVGITIATSYTTLAELARFAGWGEYMSWAFPAALDLLALVACRIWLSPTFPPHARTYAKWVTMIASGLSVAGNGVGHLASTGHIAPGLLLVVMVGSVAPASLATVVHLASLASAPVPGRKARHKVAEQTKLKDETGQTTEAPSKPKAEKPKPKAKPSTARDLLAEAREANRLHNEQYGQHISLNRLRPALRISRGKASEIHRLLMEEVA